MIEKNEPAEKPRGRWLKRIGLALLVGVVVCVGLFVAWRVGVGRELQQELDRIRAEGLPATAEELDAWYEHVPDEENAALVWLEVAELMRELPDPEQQMMVPFVGSRWTIGDNPPKPWEPWSEDQLEGLDEYLTLNRQAIEKAREALGMKRTRYPGSLAAQTTITSNRHLYERRKTARLVHAFVQWAVQNGDAASAVNYTEALFALGESLRHEALVLNQLVRIAILALAVDASERLLNRLEATEEHMLAIDAALHRATQVQPIRQGLVGERATFAHFVEHGINSGANGREWLVELARESGYLPLNRVYHLQRMRQLIEAADLPFEQRVAVARRIERESEEAGWLEAMGAMLLPSYDRAFEAEAIVLARIRLARTAIAVERYRLAHSKTPDKLDALVPDYLDAIPLDPFTDQPVIYRTEENGHFIVYSVGIDLTDHGGLRENEAGEEFKPGSDIVFEIRR